MKKIACVLSGIIILCSALGPDLFAMGAFTEPPLSDTELIKKLIQSTPAEGVCEIPEGDYEVSCIAITRPITVRSAGNVSLRPMLSPENASAVENNFVFSIWSDEVSIEGCRFESSYAGGSAGIIHCTGNDLNIRDNVFAVAANSAAIISYADTNLCMVERNVFIAHPGARSFPMLQFHSPTSRACITGNTLEANSPETLSPDFFDHFMMMNMSGILIKDNDFLYTGNISPEDLGGYEDEDFVFDGDEPSSEAFARIKSAKLKELNPWRTNDKPSTRWHRVTGSGDPKESVKKEDKPEKLKLNPETGSCAIPKPFVSTAALVFVILALNKKLIAAQKFIRHTDRCFLKNK